MEVEKEIEKEVKGWEENLEGAMCIGEVKRRKYFKWKGVVSWVVGGWGIVKDKDREVGGMMGDFVISSFGGVEGLGYMGRRWKWL